MSQPEPVVSRRNPSGAAHPVQLQPRHAAQLQLRNPSPYNREGVVVTDWEPIAKASRVDPETVRISIAGERLRAQVDPIDPSDPSRAQLAFILDRPICDGVETYDKPCALVNVNDGTADTRFGARVERHLTGAKLINNRMEVWINTAVEGNDPHLKCFAGALTTILQYRENSRPFDLLDGIASHHHLLGYAQKRLQVDRVRLAHAAWSPELYRDEYLHDKPWTIVSTSEGPVRACVTIRSHPFDYQTRDFAGAPVRTYRCNVFRAFSLFHDDDVVHEQMWVRGVPTTSGDPVDLAFSPRYFMMTDLGPEPLTFRYPNLSGWFVLLSKVAPHHGYSFACNSAAGPLWIPPLDWPDRDLLLERAFTWELEPVRVAQCVHTFRFGTQLEQSDAAGWMWYTRVFKPLRATLA